MLADENKAFKKLSGQKPLRVFRGWSRDGGELGYSWTLNVKKAAWFGGRMAKHDNPAGYAYVAWGWVKRNDALGHFTRRSEDEIFASWERVDVSSVDICRFADWPEPTDTRPVVSFDFDGTLHSAVNAGGHPVNFHSDRLPPRRDIIDKLKAAAGAGNKVVIVTRRDYSDLGAVLRFCSRHALPVATVYPTHDRPKEPYLETIKAVAHYDDQEIHYPGAVKV